MSNNGNAVAVRQDASPILDEQKIELLRESIANGAPSMEFELFVNVCNRTGLDPFARQIYFIERGKKWSWQTSIDGYRLIADRTGNYAGSDEPVCTEKDGKPLTATVTVWKFVQGQRCAFTATARWAEYNQPNSPTWNRMPYLMLSKCAESLALRKAFPAELSGLYTREEMMQADTQAFETGEYEVIAADAETGEIVEHDTAGKADGSATSGTELAPMNQIEEEHYAALLAAKSLAALNAEAARIADGGVTHPSLRDAYRTRRDELQAAKDAKQPELVTAQAGDPGDDRFSR
jgi:phage recombination protein Bet